MDSEEIALERIVGVVRFLGDRGDPVELFFKWQLFLLISFASFQGSLE